MVKAALNQRPESIALLKQALEQKETAPPATKGTISDLQDGNRTVVLKLADGKTFEAKVSGSRTEITVGGQKSDRNAMKTGMTCSIEAPKSGAEAKTIACN
jgi:hypothetical protein